MPIACGKADRLCVHGGGNRGEGPDRDKCIAAGKSVVQRRWGGIHDESLKEGLESGRVYDSSLCSVKVPVPTPFRSIEINRCSVPVRLSLCVPLHCCAWVF